MEHAQKKVYTCAVFPSLTIGTANRKTIGEPIKFNRGIFETADQDMQAAIEESDSFKQGYIREYRDDKAPPPLPEKKDVVRMTKEQLVEFTSVYGIDIPGEGHRRDYVSAVIDFLTEAEEIAATQE